MHIWALQFAGSTYSYSCVRDSLTIKQRMILCTTVHMDHRRQHTENISSNNTLSEFLVLSTLVFLSFSEKCYLLYPFVSRQPLCHCLMFCLLFYFFLNSGDCFEKIWEEKDSEDSKKTTQQNALILLNPNNKYSLNLVLIYKINKHKRWYASKLNWDHIFRKSRSVMLNHMR